MNSSLANYIHRRIPVSMKELLKSARGRWLRNNLPALVVSLVGLIVLLGWFFGIQSLKEVFPGMATMKANTALAFLLIGVSMISYRAMLRGGWRIIVARMAAFVVLLIGGFTLLEYALAKNLGIDEFLVVNWEVQNPYPGRPAAATAICITLIGFALVLIRSRQPAARILVQCQVLAVILISGLAAVGYLYGVESLYKVAPYSSVALHTALTFLVACVGLLQTEPCLGLMAPLKSSNAGGVIARRLLPGVIFFPLLLAWLRLKGEHLGFYSLEFGVALLAVANIVVLSIFLWFNIRSLNRLDAEKLGMERQLEQSRANRRFKELLESAPDAMVIVDGKGQIVLVNTQTEKLFGYQRKELLGHAVEILIPERYRSDHPAHRNSYFSNPRVREMAAGMELFGRRSDGSEFPAEVSLSPLETEEGVLVCSVIRDITRRKQAEEETRHRLQQEKLAEHRAELAHVLRLNTMGEMATGIAHELNQPLSTIANYARGCVRRLECGSIDHGVIIEAGNLIAQEAIRASEIIRSLNRYVKKCAPQRALVDINSVVRDAAQIVVGEANRHDVVLNLNCTDGLPKISGDPVQLEQVLVNLLINGIDALDSCDSRRLLTVRTGRSATGDIEVLVSDNGSGLPVEFEHKIFEPFFTTKEHGLGMGLAIGRSMVEAHGGRLRAEGNEYGGATFRFTVPCALELIHAS